MFKDNFYVYFKKKKISKFMTSRKTKGHLKKW